MLVRSSHPMRRLAARGFTLIELLVTLVIIAVGLLGMAKLQAAAVNEVGVARTRSLMTFQAESLASMMRANEAFWQTTTVSGQTFGIAAGGAVTAPGATSPAGGTCTGVTTCTAANMAYDDLNTWATSFAARFPTATGKIVCGTTTPVTCDITLTWTEHSVAVNTTTAAAATGASGVMENKSYMVLHVQP